MARTICELCGKLFMKAGISEDDICVECRSDISHNKDFRYADD